MKKWSLLSALVALTAVLALAGCSSSKNQPLAESFNKQQTIEKAHQVINSLEANDDKESFFSMASDELKSALTKDQLNGALTQVMPNAGAFKSFDGDAVVGEKDENGNDVAVVVSRVKYENQIVTFTIGFNTQMKMIGFFLK